MKRILTLTIAALLVFGLAAVTYAGVEFGASGFVRVRSAWYTNVVAAGPGTSFGIPLPTIGIPGFAVNTAWDDTNAWMDTRFRLKFTANAEDMAKGVIYLEGDATRWGEVAGAGAQRNQAGQWGADRAAIELKQMFIDFKIPGLSEMFPASLKAGIIGYAYRAHLLTYNDGTGVQLSVKTGPVKWDYHWMKPRENNDWQADDTDVYAFRATLVDLLPVRPQFHFQYWNSNSWSAVAPFAWPAVGAMSAVNTGQNGGTDTADLFWAGIAVDGKAGPVALKADFIYNWGDIERQYPFNPAAPVALYTNPIDDEDFGGWVFYADANMGLPIEMPINVGGTFMYATGDDIWEAQTEREHEGFWITPSSEAGWIGTHGVVFYPSRVNDGVGAVAIFRANTPSPNGPGGTWFGKLYGSFKPLDWLKLTAYGMYIGDTADSGDMYGTEATTTFIDPVTGLPRILREDNSDIGIEFGLITDFQIYKNLKYSIAGGYLFGGDAINQYTGVDFVPATGAYVLGGTVPGALAINDEPNNPWAIVSQLIFNF
jgi:hypothetical protein